MCPDPEPGGAAHRGRARQVLAHGEHRRHARHQRLAHRRRAPARDIHVRGDRFVGRGEVALVGVVHLLEEVDALVVVVEQAGLEAQALARLHFAQEGQVGFEREGRDAVRLAVLGGEAEELEEGLRGDVERDVVVAHVHVPVVVDPFGQDDGGGAGEGRGDVVAALRAAGGCGHRERSMRGAGTGILERIADSDMSVPARVR